jgi:cytochrome P450
LHKDPVRPFYLNHSFFLLVEIDGYGIPAGSWILSSFEHMQTSPHFIKDGDKLDFKRYVNSKSTLQSTTKGRIENRELFTFGWGKRSCPGVHLVRQRGLCFKTSMFKPFIGKCSTLCYFCWYFLKMHH